MEKTAMQALIDLISINDAYKESMPFLLDIINEVYLPKEKQQIVDAWDLGRRDIDYPANGEQYYTSTFNS